MATLKLLHILFVFVWIGTLLTLSRLMGYLGKEDPLVQKRMGAIAKRMYLLVDLPSMLMAISLGLTLLFLKDMNWKAPWLHMKLTFAFALIVCDLLTGWKITKGIKEPTLCVAGEGQIVAKSKTSSVGYKILHGLAGLFFIGVLVAIYILKQIG